MKTNFKLYQMSFDGSTVLDSEHETVEQAQETSANLGSKWFFYPLSVIVKGKTIVETGGSLCHIKSGEPCLSKMFKGKRLITLKKVFSTSSKLPELENANFEEFEQYILDKF